MENKRRKDRNLEVLLENDSHLAQEFVYCNYCGVDEIDPELIMNRLMKLSGLMTIKHPVKIQQLENFLMKISIPRMRSKCLKKVNMNRMEFKY
uniref:Uncharacterized protein n=1 Tax=Lactuca sativa TaxID=4236 RepID=A0A9R1X1T2_LACSA|nr:hypothetical protein LSAT_V11C800413050 [Lactuca sativa]